MSNDRGFRDTVYWQVLEVLGKLLAAPGVVLILSSVVDIPDNVVNVLSITVLVVSAVVLFGRRHRNRLLVTLLIGLCLVLSALLVLTLLKLYKDPWVQWRDDVVAAVEACDKDNDFCIARALQTKLPEADDPTVVGSRLSRDMRAGSIIMQNGRVKTMLERHFGIDGAFLGVGFSKPHGANHYETARIPEFLVPNYPESHPRVWRWRLEPGKFSETSLRQLILAQKPIDKDLQFKERIQDHLSIDDTKPAVVRIAQFPGPPSGYLGWKKTRVFVSHLGQMLDLKLKDVEKYSGRRFEVKEAAEGEVLYIWIFVPADGEIIPATWENILTHSADWFPKT